MTRSAWWVLAAGTMVLACHPSQRGNRSGADAPSPSLAAEPGHDGTRVERTFPAAGISKVIFRAAFAKDARVTPADGQDIRVAGTPQGGAPGYHPSDPKWRETSAQDWGLDFKAKPFGATLVISTSNELHYIHHSYYLDGLVITVPKGIEVTLEAKPPTENGPPDLRDPSSASPPAKE